MERGAVCQPFLPRDERSGLQTQHRDDGKRFVVRADETLTAFLELELAIVRVPAKPNANFVSLYWMN
jgi:hypothetical protein